MLRVRAEVDLLALPVLPDDGYLSRITDPEHATRLRRFLRFNGLALEHLMAEGSRPTRSVRRPHIVPERDIDTGSNG